MKKISLSALMMLILGSILTAGNIKTTYEFKNYRLEDKGVFISLNIDGCLNTALPGQPALPYKSVALLLDDNQQAAQMEIVLRDPLTIHIDKDVFPMQYSRPLSEGPSGEFIMDKAVYQTRSAFPSNKKGHLKNASMNGYEFALSSFTPVEYFPAEGKIVLYQEVDVILKTSAMRNEGLRASAAKKVRNRVARFADNPEKIRAYSPKATRSEAYDILIVTKQQYLAGFEDLVQMYLNRGMKAMAVSIDSINTTMNGNDVQARIRNFIIQEYQTKDIQHVLLGGDTDVVPYRGFYCEVQSSSLYTDDDIPADLYYSALDGTWNDDGDNKWGEPEEDDLLPDISVARMTFSNANELAVFIHKSTQYQNNPVLGELRNPLLAGEDLYDDPQTWGAQYLELLVGWHDDNGYTTDGIPANHNIEEMFDRDLGNWSKNDIINKINSGKQFVHHSGHANSSSLMRLYTSDITNSNFSGANGVDHNYTLVYTHGCICGAFDENDCIAERIVGIDNFAVAGAFNSRYGWFNEGQTEGPSAHMHREFVNALYTDKENHIGAAHMISKIETSPWVTAPGQHEDGALRWCFYDCNILGDPALAVWTDEPLNNISATFQEEIPVGWETLNVTVTKGSQPLENYRCAILKDGQLHGYAMTNENGVAEIAIEPLITEIGQAQVVLSGYNVLPEEFPLGIVASGTPVVNYSSYTVHDEAGNNDGQPDFGESITLDMELSNIGYAMAENVHATLSSTNEYITITDSEADFGNIEALENGFCANAYAFDICDSIPDQHWVMLKLDIVSNDFSWTKSFMIMPNAPRMQVGEITIDDSEGNNDHRLDPGESAHILIRSYNKGHGDAFPTRFALNCDNEMISIQNAVQDLDLEGGKFRELIFDVQVDENIPLYSLANFTYSMTHGHYSDEMSFVQSIGYIDEDFESGDYSKFDWTFESPTAWEICETDPYEGDYCSMSGEIGAGGSSKMSLSLRVENADSISFYHKLSTEEGYDKLLFYIDDNEMGQWSGIKGWERFSTFVNEGIHTFTWEYKKDMFEDAGEDRVWIDEIIFPPVSTLTSIEETGSDALVSLTNIYPNPIKDQLKLEMRSQAQKQANIRIVDACGATIQAKSVYLNEGMNHLTIASDGFAAGVYVLFIETDGELISKKITKH